MDPRCSGQDVLRCSVCRTAVTFMFCNTCQIYLCKDCVEKHFETDTVHNVVPLRQFLYKTNYPKCVDHPIKQCEFYCEQCDIPVCALGLSLGKHKLHKTEDILNTFIRKKELVQKDLQELEKCIHPKYQEAATNIPLLRADASRHSLKLTLALNKQRENFHIEIDKIFHKMQSEINVMDVQHLAAIAKQEEAINCTIKELSKTILVLKEILDSKDICVVSKYKSRNGEFRKLPPKLKVSLPNFKSQMVNREKILEQFGSLTPLSIESEQESYTLQSPEEAETQEAESPSLDGALLEFPRIITEMDTGYKSLSNVSCLSDEEIWTGGDDKIMKLFNLQGELVKVVQTKSENEPKDIAVTSNGDLVYIDSKESSIYIVNKTTVLPLITLRGWRPLNVCSSTSGDLLVTMISEDEEETKVVRYSGSTEKQSIQWDDQGFPLYSANPSKFLSENRNLDICVADRFACAIVVVNVDGEFRFKYEGAPSLSVRKFTPRGIATDGEGLILTTDFTNHCIHVLDQDGHFLRYIDNCQLQTPWGICVDSSDNLFVVERKTSKVKKIQYYK